jgi:hypothetical protein
VANETFTFQPRAFHGLAQLQPRLRRGRGVLVSLPLHSQQNLLCMWSMKYAKGQLLALFFSTKTRTRRTRSLHSVSLDLLTWAPVWSVVRTLTAKRGKNHHCFAPLEARPFMRGVYTYIYMYVLYIYVYIYIYMYIYVCVCV